MPPSNIGLTVILPCSARKPYSKSKSHQNFRKYIKRGAKEKISLVHEVVLTSPLGLVPRELENIYPAAHYDVPVTGHWSYEEREIASKLLADYLSKTGKPAIAHVTGDYRKICGDLDIEMTDGGLGIDELMVLSQMIEKALVDIKPQKWNWRKGGIKAVCEFQFGKGASEIMIPEEAVVRGNQVGIGREQIAAINPTNGYLALSLSGGELLKKFGKNRVTLSFKPETNSIFAVGVEDADPGIRPNDEVVALYDGNVVGIGRAILNSRELVNAKIGLAVKLRHHS